MAVLVLVAANTACGRQSNAPAANQPITQNAAQSNQTPAQSNAPAAIDAETRDVNTASGITDGVAMEKAADDFARRYPQSRFRVSLYVRTAGLYAGQRDWAGELRAGDKALALAPHNASALTLTAMALENLPSASEAERTTQQTTIRERITDALQHVDDDQAPEDQRRNVRGLAYAALGLLELQTQDDAAAERGLTTATQALPQQASAWYSLALAQEHLKKYDAGLASIEKALQLDPGDKFSLDEQQDLKRLAASTVKARLITVAMVAALVPAWRASRTDPLVALRE